MPTLAVSDLGGHVAPDLGGAPWIRSEGVLMIDAASFLALGTALGVAVWVVVSLVVSVLIGLVLRGGRGSS